MTVYIQGQANMVRVKSYFYFISKFNAHFLLKKDEGISPG